MQWLTHSPLLHRHTQVYIHKRIQPRPLYQAHTGFLSDDPLQGFYPDYWFGPLPTNRLFSSAYLKFLRFSTLQAAFYFRSFQYIKKSIFSQRNKTYCETISSACFFAKMTFCFCTFTACACWKVEHLPFESRLLSSSLFLIANSHCYFDNIQFPAT